MATGSSALFNQKSLHARFLLGSAASATGTAHAGPQSLSARLQQLSVY